MIRKSLEPNTKVFHLIHGIGTFLRFQDDKTALVNFTPKSVHAVRRKELTEFVD